MSKILSKIIATCLVIMMLLTNVLIIGVYFAGKVIAIEDGSLEMQDSTTNHQNVEFDAYFKEGETEKHTSVFEVGDSNAILYLKLNVKKEGYLKNAKVTLENANYEINTDIGESQIVQEISENQILYKQIGGGVETIRPLEIRKKQSERSSIDETGKESNIKLEATYIDNDGNEIAIEKTVQIHVGWTDENKIAITEEVEKYIKNENEIILQNKIEIERTEGILAVEKTEIELDAIKIGEYYPETVEVIGNSTKGTNGREDEKVEFNQNNYSYNSQTGKINIQIQNQEENGSVWAGKGKDSISILSTYGQEAYEYMETKGQEEIALKITVKMQIKNHKETVETVETLEKTETIGNVQGKIIEENIKAQETEINKGKIYANSTNSGNNYETEYNIKWKTNISKLGETIKLESNSDVFVGLNDQTNIAYYKKTTVEESNFLEILGENGNIKIYSGETEIGTIQKGNYEIIYEENQIENVRIETTEPISNGNLYIMHAKVIKSNLGYSKDELKQATGIKSSIGEKTSIINLIETTSKASISLNKDILYAGQENENVEIQIKLHNSDQTKDLYKNPSLEIELPEEIENVEITGSKILFDDELSIKNTNVEEVNGKRVIKVELSGEQTKFNENIISEGTNLLITANLSLKEIEESKREEIKLKYTNENSTNYEEQEESYGISKTNINIGKVSKQEENGNQNLGNGTQVAPGVNYEMNLTTSVGEEAIHEGQIFSYIVTVKNTGTQAIENAVVTIPVPEGTVYVKYEIRDESNEDEEYGESIGYYEYENITEMPYTIVQLNANETATCELLVKAKKITMTQESIKNKAKIQIGEEIQETEEVSNELKEATASIVLCGEKVIKSLINEEIRIPIIIQNLTEENITDIQAQIQLPEELEYVDLTIDTEGITNANYDEVTKTLFMEISQIEDFELVTLVVSTKETKQSKLIANLVANGENIKSNEIGIQGENINIEVSHTSPTAGETLEQGDEIEYIITIKNNSQYNLANLSIIDVLPEILEFNEAICTITDAQPFSIQSIQDGVLRINWNLEAQKQLELKITGTVGENTQSLSEIQNEVTISATNLEERKLNSVIHYLKGIDIPEEKFKISGNVWVDTNKNGVQEEIEDKLEGITVRLLNAETNEFMQDIEAITKEDGSYELSNISKGRYMVVISYDSSKYSITEYKKENALEEATSKFIKATLTENDETKEVAITDILFLEQDLENIHLGLIENEVFDLKLDKYINKVIVQNSQGTRAYEYNNSKIEKIEIPSRYLAESTVLIEYKMIVTNEGEVAGYASELVDNLPRDLTFSSELNNDWYVGEDGKIHTRALEADLIQPGETREVLLILRKRMTETNAGNTNNTAEIYEASNELGIEDIDSTPGNENQREDDISSADVVISIKTGEGIGTVIIILLISIGIIAGGSYIIKKTVLEERG